MGHFNEPGHVEETSEMLKALKEEAADYFKNLIKRNNLEDWDKGIITSIYKKKNSRIP